MRLGDVTTRLGEPESVERFVPDRTTYNFTCGASDRYAVSCTIHGAAGLIYVTVLAPTRAGWPLTITAEKPDLALN